MDFLCEILVKTYLYEEEFVPYAMASSATYGRWSLYLEEVRADYASLVSYENDKAEQEAQEAGELTGIVERMN